LNYEANLVYEGKNYWLVLKRTLLAGFEAPIDSHVHEIARHLIHNHVEQYYRNTYTQGEIPGQAKVMLLPA